MDLDYYAIQFALIFSGARPAFLIQDTEFRKYYVDVTKNMKEIVARASELVKVEKYKVIYSRKVTLGGLTEVYFSSSELKEYSDEQLNDNTIRARLLGLVGTYNDETRAGKFFTFRIMCGELDILTYICPDKEEGMCDFHAAFLLKEFNERVRAPFRLEKTTDLGEKYLEKSIIEGRYEGLDEIINYIWNSGYLPSDDYFYDLNDYKKGVLTALWFIGKYDVDDKFHMRLKASDRDFVDAQKKLTADLILESSGSTFKSGIKNAVTLVWTHYPYRVRNLSKEVGETESEYKKLLKEMFTGIATSLM